MREEPLLHTSATSTATAAPPPPQQQPATLATPTTAADFEQRVLFCIEALENVRPADAQQAYNPPGGCWVAACIAARTV